MVNFESTDSCNMKLLSTALFSGAEVRIVPVEYIGTPHEERKRRHKKRRIDKKWQKRYGFSTRYYDDCVLMVNGVFWMTRKTYERLKKMRAEC